MKKLDHYLSVFSTADIIPHTLQERFNSNACGIFCGFYEGMAES